MQNPNNLVDYLFIRFAFIWDKKWENKIKDAEDEKRKIWSIAISGLTRKQLDAGINAALLRFTWPPEPREFIECCTGKKPNEASAVPEERFVDANNGHYSYCTSNGCRMPATMYSTRWVCNKHWKDGK